MLSGQKNEVVSDGGRGTNGAISKKFLIDWGSLAPKGAEGREQNLKYVLPTLYLVYRLQYVGDTWGGGVCLARVSSLKRCCCVDLGLDGEMSGSFGENEQKP